MPEHNRRTPYGYLCMICVCERERERERERQRAREREKDRCVFYFNDASNSYDFMPSVVDE